MAKLTVLEELDAAIRTAAAEAEPQQTSREIAADLCESNPELIEPFLREWAVAKVAGLIAAHRRKTRRERDVQYQLGFTHIPRTIKLRSGKIVARADATSGAFHQLAAQFRKQGHPAQAEVDAALVAFSKYTAKEPKITWGDVLLREAKKKGLSQ